MSVTFHFMENFKKKRRYMNLLKLFYLFKRKTCFENQTCFPFRKSVCSALAKKRRNKGLIKERKVKKLRTRDSLQEYNIKFRKKTLSSYERK